MSGHVLLRLCLAAGIAILLSLPVAEAQQQRTKNPLPLVRDFIGKALNEIRRPPSERPARQAQERRAIEVARLPRPRPDATGPRSVAATGQPANLSADASRLAEMPKDFGASGLEASTRTLPPPAELTAFVAPESDFGPARAAPGTAQDAIGSLARMPRARPEGSPLLAMVDPRAGIGAELPVGPMAEVESARDLAACLERLRALQVAFTEEPSVGEVACHVAHPLKVTSVGSGVALLPEAVLNCRTAEALALWTRNVVLPAASELLQAKPARIVHRSAYVCRPRNNQPGAKLSEHAHANAVDISLIAFADREPVDIGAADAAEAEGAFQAAIRQGACAYFTTVLGPGSDAAHETHFHFDLADRRSGYRLCELGVPVAAEEAEKTKRE